MDKSGIVSPPSQWFSVATIPPLCGGEMNALAAKESGAQRQSNGSSVRLPPQIYELFPRPSGGAGFLGVVYALIK
jgi:hypothetical protein